MIGLPRALSGIKPNSKVFMYAVDREFPVVGVLEKPLKVGEVPCLQEIGSNYTSNQWNKLKGFELGPGVIVDTSLCLVWLTADSNLWDTVNGFPHGTHDMAFDQNVIAWALEDHGDSIDIEATQSNRVYQFIKDREAVMATLHPGTIVKFVSSADRKAAAKRVIEAALPGMPSRNIGGGTHISTSRELYERLWDIAFNGLGVKFKIDMADFVVAFIEQLIKVLHKMTPYGQMKDFFTEDQLEFFNGLREEVSVGGLQIALENASDCFSGGPEDMVFEEQLDAFKIFLEMAVQYEVLDLETKS